MTYEEIQKELRTLSDKLSESEELTVEEIETIEARVNELETEKKSIKEKAEKRDATLKKVQNGLIGTEVESAEVHTSKN